MIICYTNTSVDKYNDIMLKHLKFNSMFDVGVKLLCKTNNLRKYGIYNRFVLEITKDGLTDGINTYNLTEKEIKQNFKPAYARTVYGCQGKSLKSYYYAPEDYEFLKLSNQKNRIAYTIISRLKNKE